MHTNVMVLALGKERAIVFRHQWIFSGAVRSLPPTVEDGACVDVCSSDGSFLGRALVNRKSAIIGRIITFERKSAEDAICAHLQAAVSFRKALFGSLQGRMYRLVNAEADMLSGLVIDVYDTVAVVQVSTLGMNRYLPVIVDVLRSELALTWIYEKSTSPSRKREGLLPKEGTLWGEEQSRVVVAEDGLQFLISIKEGQKTGFFIDQRESREIVRRLAPGRRVLNCFSYSGAFSVAALAAGARSCCSVDVSAQALQLAEANVALNHLDSDGRHTVVCADVFPWLDRESLDYDLVILDPPAFAKRRQDVPSAMSGYQEINRRAIAKMPAGSFLLTCSCSYHVQPSEFLAMLKSAAHAAKRQVRVVSHHRHAWDHPMNLFHPETDYLKSALLYVT